MAHTPGPWASEQVASDHNQDVILDYAIEREGFPILIASTFGDDDGQRPTVAESEANARLIAAAPDLLAACQFVMTKIKECMAEMEAAGQKPQIKDYEEVAVIQSAIDKATLAR